jgi:hypothetical protein
MIAPIPSLALDRQHLFAPPQPAVDWERVGKKPDPPPEAVPVVDLFNGVIDHSKTLLGNRYLERGGSMVIVGSSGIGKSSSSMQQDILWAVGREAFGIKPSKPLKILTIQAENDRGDLTEMAQGVMRGIKLTPEENELLKKNVHYVFEQSRTGSIFLSECVRPLLEKYRPDILRIDPFMAYLGGDITHAKDTAAFLRQGLNPLLTEFGCACILVHHTTKTSGRDTTKFRPDDFMYLGAGSADIVNWARAVLVIDSSQERGKYRFLAAKRGSRIGWLDKNYGKTQERWFQHSVGSYCWEECKADEIPEVNAKHKAEDILKVMPYDGTIEKQALINKANKASIPLGVIRSYIDELIEKKLIVEEEIPRKGARAKKVLRRVPRVKSEYANIPKREDLLGGSRVIFTR